jgi:hypothetical protein
VLEDLLSRNVNGLNRGAEKGGRRATWAQAEEGGELGVLPRALMKVVLEDETAVRVWERSRENLVLKRTVSQSLHLRGLSAFSEVNDRFP